MKISIADRLRPFSHSPGHKVMVPGTGFMLQVFPTYLECVDVKSLEKTSFSWDLKGPVDPFTVEQDLEKLCIRIYGESIQGYFRFVIKAEGGKVLLSVEKAPLKGTCLQKGEITLAEGVCMQTPSSLERLFLGSSKQKDTDAMRRRKDLAELLPVWFHLGQMTPSVEEKKGEMLALLDLVDEKVRSKDKSVNEVLLKTYLAGFSSGFVPRAYDDEFQGIISQEEDKTLTALSLLPKGALSIRSLFFQEEKGVYHFLPCLPSKFASGKLLGIKTKEGSSIDIEWTKHKVRRVCITSQKEQELRFTFAFGMKKYRLRKSLKDKGQIIQVGDALKVKAGESLLLDCFQV